MNKVYKRLKYRLYPSKRQKSLLRNTLNECRWLYNHLLEGRRDSWENHQKSLTAYAQQATYPVLKEKRPSLKKVHSQVLQNVAVRLSRSFKSFFRRVQAGEEPGYPRFKGKNQYNSFLYPQFGKGWKLDGETIKFNRIGKMKIVLHRPLIGKVKTCSVKKTPTGKWFATFCCECEPTTLPQSSEETGIDMGLKTFATLSSGESIKNPKFFKKEEKALAKAQSSLSSVTKGSSEYEKRRKIVSRIHERIKWRRDNFVHQHSRRVINKFGLVVVEDLEVNRMVRNKLFSKSISDAAWSSFTSLLSCKAEWAGREFIKVDPAYTSQTCSNCGRRQKMPLSKRTYICPSCNLRLDRDHNAANNILALGRQCLSKT